MNVRERILTIRLLEKALKNPAYAEALGVEVIEVGLRGKRRMAPPEHIPDSRG